jgi:hypothetical protein
MLGGLMAYALALLVSLLLLLPASRAEAQRENNVWYFGQGAGIDFNGSAPVPLTDGAIDAVEGCASIADPATGALLFYTDGITVWNRLHRPMPNGTGLDGGLSSVQSALIVPLPGSPGTYLLFSSQQEGSLSNPDRGVVYSVVEMSADGGLGDVTRKNVRLIAPTTEKLVGVRHCNGRDYWIITHTPGDDAYHAFLVSPAGVAATDMVSHAGNVHTYHAGWLAASPNGRKLASLVSYDGSLELLDFDNCTGRVSNARTLLARLPAYGTCFSPDNTKLYAVLDSTPPTLLQFDLSSGNAVTPLASVMVQRPTTGFPAAMQLGPDGRIYVAKVRTGWLGVIDQPNVAGTACGYRDSGFVLGGKLSLWGLPNLIQSGYAPPRALLAGFDTLLCVGSCIGYGYAYDSTTGLPASLTWRFPGGIPSADSGHPTVEVCYAATGRYPVSIAVGNRWGSDTLVSHITVVDRAPAGVVRAGSVAAVPGDTVTLPILLFRSEPAGSGYARPFVVRLRYDASVLLPLDTGLVTSLAGGERVITLRGSASPAADTLITLRMLATLGDAERSPIVVDSALWLGPCAGMLDTGAGELRLADLCTDGGTRLVAPGGAALKVASGGDAVIYDAGERGPVRLYLVDMSGREAALLFDGEAEAGEHAARLDDAGLAPGRYLCVLRTPSRILGVPLLLGR